MRRGSTSSSLCFNARICDTIIREAIIIQRKRRISRMIGWVKTSWNERRRCHLLIQIALISNHENNTSFFWVVPDFLNPPRYLVKRFPTGNIEHYNRSIRSSIMTIIQPHTLLCRQCLVSLLSSCVPQMKLHLSASYFISHDSISSFKVDSTSLKIRHQQWLWDR